VKKRQANTIRNFLMIAAAILIFAHIAAATGTAPYFTPVPPSIMYCYQNSTCFYDFNATDDQGDPMNFSINKPPFGNYINPNTGIMNFTPTNDDVGVYTSPSVVAIVQETDTGNLTFALINWYIININDAPNITAYSPDYTTIATTKENALKDFNITADDLDLKHNDTLNFTWLIDGVINTTLLKHERSGMNSTANYTPDFLSAGVHNITVNVTDNQSAYVSITWIVNVSNENRACFQNKTINNITMTEDTPLYNALNISEHFFDNDTDDTHSYSSTFVTGNNVNVLIDSNAPNNVSFVPNSNFFGVNIIQFSCYDGYNQTYSHNVTINVTGVNDPPTVQQASDQIAYANSLFQIQVVASDVDLDLLTYYDNTSLFAINPSNGFISFIPNSGQIGNYSLAINVSDGTVNTTMVFNLSIINNTAPALGGKPLPDIYTTEGNYTLILFNATDADSDDTLSFTSTGFRAVVVTTNSSYLGAQGRIAFTPNQSDIGTWTVTIYVNDTRQAFDSDTFNLYISDVEHDPVLRLIANQRMKVNKTFTMTIYADDEDGDINGWLDNTTLFGITLGGTGANATGTITFTPTDADLGEHWVNITVTDSSGRRDYQTALFNVTGNTPPTIPPIDNQTIFEDHLLSLHVNATDPDTQDTLFFWDNTTLFEINNATGMIEFSPNNTQLGNFTVNISVTDGEANASTLLYLSIGTYNDFPYFIPPLEQYYVNGSTYRNTSYWNDTNILNYTTNWTVWNVSIYQDKYSLIHIYAYDEEYLTTEFGNETILLFSRSFVNFTNASNNTATSGINLFGSILNYDGETGIINFTPTNDQVGVYYVNITVDDTTQQNGTPRTNTTTLRLEVFNVNDAPTVTNYSPNITYYVNMSENSSQVFNVTATDIDYGDTVRYQWKVNGTSIAGANKSYFNYTTDFFSAGWKNVSVVLTDNLNTTTTFNWTVNVSNVNRIGWYGQIRQYNYTHFNAGLRKENITVLPGEQGMTIYNTGTGFSPNGTFESYVLDTGETGTDSTGENSRSEFTTINWTGNLTPPGGVLYNIYFQAKVGETPSNVTGSQYDPSVIYTLNNAQLVFTNKRYTQYKLFMATSDTNFSPIMNSVTLGYKIADFKVEQDNSGMIWIYLDKYFYDPDTDDKLTYNVTTPNGTAVTGINITISNTTSRVTLNTVGTPVGSIPVVFHMSDGYNTTDSSIININITEVQQNIVPIIIPVGGGGGGSVSQPVPYEVPKYVTTPVSFRLITPQIVTTYENNTMEVPINIFNSNFTMTNLKLKAETSNKNVTLKLSRDKFETLKPNDKQFITLYVQSYKTYGMYDIVVDATAQATSVAEDGKESTSEFHERAKIFVNSLLKAEGNESQVNTKLAFAEDLLTTNPECLELNEFLTKAAQLLAANQDAEAEKILGQVVESCKYLLAPREARAEIEAPAKVYGMPTESAFILSMVAVVTLIVAIALVIGWAHMKAKRNELTRKRQE
jgi:hypothetical protein